MRNPCKLVLKIPHILIIASSLLIPISCTPIEENPQTETVMPTTFSNTPDEINPSTSSQVETAFSTVIPTTEPDPRPSPEDWMNWDVVPWISARAVDIYLHGLSLGTNPHAFSVVGDCQAISEVFLGMYANPHLYTLTFPYNEMQPTIDQYEGSFDRHSQAVRGGYSAASILNPVQADPEFCNPGETPLECEIRQNNPSILIISLEVWFDPDTVDRYEVYLREIIEYTIARGILPVLINKADLNEGQNHVINPALANLAAEYQIPLANFWRLAQTLPNRGIDPEREGFHLSAEGYRMKSLVALAALDAVWNAVQNLEVQSVYESPNESQPADETTISEIQSLAPACVDASQCAVFDLLEGENGINSPAGIFGLDIDSGQVNQWIPESYRLQDVTTNGQTILFSREHTLFQASIAGGEPILITDTMVEGDGISAVFLGNDETVVWLAFNTNTNNSILQSNDPTMNNLALPDGHPLQFFPTPWNDRVALQFGSECESGECTSEINGIFSLLSGEMDWVESVINPVYSPDGNHFAFLDATNAPTDVYEFNETVYVEDLALPQISRRAFMFQPANGYLVRNRPTGYYFSRDGSWLLIWMEERSNYYEISAGSRTYLVQLSSGIYWEYERVMDLHPRATWSSDSNQMLEGMVHIDPVSGSDIRFRLVDLATRQERFVSEQPALTVPGYQYINQLFWVRP